MSNAFGSILSSNAVLVVTTNITWTGAASSDWNNPANWYPLHVPTASDHVIINSGSVTIPADAAFAVMDWTGGSIGGSLTVASNGVINASGGATKSLNGALTNYGTVNWSGGDWTINNNGGYTGAVYNQPGGLFDVQCDQSLNNYLDGYDYHGTGYGFFSNAGTLRKSAGSAPLLSLPRSPTPPRWRRTQASFIFKEAILGVPLQTWRFLWEVSRPALAMVASSSLRR